MRKDGEDEQYIPLLQRLTSVTSTISSSSYGGGVGRETQEMVDFTLDNEEDDRLALVGPARASPTVHANVSEAASQAGRLQHHAGKHSRGGVLL